MEKEMVTQLFRWKSLRKVVQMDLMPQTTTKPKTRSALIQTTIRLVHKRELHLLQVLAILPQYQQKELANNVLQLYLDKYR
jgi:hypothetical protein